MVPSRLLILILKIVHQESLDIDMAHVFLHIFLVRRMMEVRVQALRIIEEHQQPDLEIFFGEIRETSR